MPKRSLRIIVTGGGTGGHTMPAIATIAAIRSRVSDQYPEVELHVLFVGSETGLEARLSREANIDFASIATGKLRRAANPVRMLNRQNVADAFRVPFGFLQAMAKVSQFRPDALFSTGGYVSVPAVFAAWIQRVPVLMHEQTVQIGLANRWSAHVSTRIALSYAESADELNAADRQKAFVTGGIVRPIVTQGSAARGRAFYGFSEQDSYLPVVFITGGAQGASIINNAVLIALPELAKICCIVHQCGKQRSAIVQDEDRLRDAAKQLPDELKHRYVVVPFIGDEIGDTYALSDLVVGRSGAGTIGELCAVGKASLLIPLVPTGGDEQTKNANRLVQAGAAETIRQSELSGTLLVDKVVSMVSDRTKLDRMGSAARGLYKPDAAIEIADAVIGLGLNGLTQN